MRSVHTWTTDAHINKRADGRVASWFVLLHFIVRHQIQSHFRDNYTVVLFFFISLQFIIGFYLYILRLCLKSLYGVHFVE